MANDREYRHAYYEANKEKLRAAGRAYYEANKEKERADHRAYYEANKEKERARNRAWREANKEEERAAQRAYQKSKNGKVATERERRLVEEQDGMCGICGREDAPVWNFDHDHSCCPAGMPYVRRCGNCERAILCSGCNTGLGFFERYSTEAEVYLRKWRQ